MKKISLQNFLIIFFSLLTIIITGLIFIIMFNVSKANKLRTFKTNYIETYYLWTEAYKAQQDFLIKHKDDIVFFQTEQNKYIKRTQIFSTKTKSKLDSLIDVSYSKNYQISDDLQYLSTEITKIDDVFSQIVHLFFLRGSQKTGIIGNCFSLYELSQNSASDQNLKNMLSKSHVAFLNYLNNPNFTYYEEFLDIFTLMNSYVRQKTVVRDTGLIDSTQFLPYSTTFTSDFIGYVNDYKQSFSKLVNLDRKLFLNDQANLMNQWSKYNTEFSEYFTNSVKIYSFDTVEDVQKLQNFILIIAVIIIFMLVIISFSIPRLISKRIKDIKEYIEPLKTGKIPDLEIDINIFSDVIEITDSIQHVINSLKASTAFANQIGTGNFDFKYTPVSEQDDLGNALLLLRDNLSKAQKEENERRKEDKIREWTNSGIAKFSDILRQAAKDINELSTVIIKELVNYLNSNQGGFFVLNEENKDNRFLELTASYAYSKERKKKKIFQLGEGLIGTCAVEKATIYMTEIPEDYISITSGLGGANPRSLLIAPLKHEDNVLGVLEIASFNKFEKYQIEFVEKIAESIASTLSITKINERTAKLLEISKIEAEQRSLKEEELRQNLEELQATQERAAYRESELHNLIAIINKVSYIIELDIDGNIVSVPESFLENYKLENSQLLGHHFSEFDFNENSILKQDDFWQKLIKGQEIQHQRKFLFQDQIIWFNDYIIPFIDSKGQVIKFVCLSFDITSKVVENEKLQEITKELKLKEKEINLKIQDIEKAREQAENEKKEAILLAQKLEVSEEALKKAVEKNKEYISHIEEAVRNSELQSQKFKMLFDRSNDAIQLLSNRKFIDCNEATLKLFGYNTKEEFINLHPSQVSPEVQLDGKNSMEKANEMMKLAVEKGYNQFKWMHRKADGTDFPAEVTLISFTIDEQLFLYALVKDLTILNKYEKDINKALELEKELKNKYISKAREYREKLEKYDIELEKKEAEIYILRDQIEKLKNN